MRYSVVFFLCVVPVVLSEKFCLITSLSYLLVSSTSSSRVSVVMISLSNRWLIQYNRYAQRSPSSSALREISFLLVAYAPRISLALPLSWKRCALIEGECEHVYRQTNEHRRQHQPNSHAHSLQISFDWEAIVQTDVDVFHKRNLYEWMDTEWWGKSLRLSFDEEYGTVVSAMHFQVFNSPKLKAPHGILIANDEENDKLKRKIIVFGIIYHCACFSIVR